MQRHPTFPKKTGFSKPELLTAAVLFFPVVGLLVARFVQGSRTNQRTSSSFDLANHLQRARLDSIKENATDITQMARVKMFNQSLCRVAVDADGDNQFGHFPDSKSTGKTSASIQCFFPKNLHLQSTRQTVDEDEKRVAPQPITLTHESA